jgi:hypothetical protein
MMNRSAMVNLILTRLNCPSLASVCNDLLQRNYELIFDAHNWRDVEHTVTTPVTSGVNYVLLDSAISRVASVAVDGNYLDPINQVTAQQFDPTLFTRTGLPECYEDKYDATSGLWKIMLYPTPAVNHSMTYIGIRANDSLDSDTATATIRNIDNVLIAFTTADMLERLLQFGMAAAKKAEAKELLAAAIEKDQSERTCIPRQVKPVTIKGDTLNDVVEQVCIRLQTWSPETKLAVQQVAQRNYLDLYEKFLWKDSIVFRSVASPVGGEITLPLEFSRVLNVREPNTTYRMIPTDLNFFFEQWSSIFDQDPLLNPAAPVRYSYLTPVATAQNPANAETFIVKSTSANDVNNKVFLRGVSGGTVVSEEITLNGTADVVTANAYERFYTFSKKKSVGDISLTGVDSTATIETLPASETGRQYIRLRFFPYKIEPLALTVLGKKNPVLYSPEDMPIVRGMTATLIYKTCADATMKDAPELSKLYADKAKEALDDLISNESIQEAYEPIVLPYTEPSALSFSSDGFSMP